MTAGPDGVLVVDKPAGPTSHDVVRVARRALGTSRIGHTGTLDPLATGVLALVVGRATRLAQFMTGAEKVYAATVVFGRATTTYDAAGETTRDTGRVPAVDALQAALGELRGTRLQTPPAFSAKKIGGEVAHRLARRDEAVALPPATVTLHEAAIESVDGAAVGLRLRVSSGFYVRSLAHELGERLGTGAHLGALRRLASGPFALEDAASMADLATAGRAIAGRIIPLDRLLPDLACADLSDDDVQKVRHGRIVQAAVRSSETGPPMAAAQGAPIRLRDGHGHLVGIATANPAGRGVEPPFLRPIVVLG